MTKPLDSHLSQREAPQPRSGRRPRTWLVALLGFGAADLLVLNLWAVPKLITNTTTTDMRAAQSGEALALVEQADLQPQAAAADHADHAEPSAQGTAAQGEPAAAQPDPAAPGEQGDLEGQAAVALAAQQGSSARQPTDSEAQPGARGEGEANQGSASAKRGAQHAAPPDRHDTTLAAQPADSEAQPGAVTAQHQAAVAPQGDVVAAPPSTEAAHHGEPAEPAPKGADPAASASAREAQAAPAPRAEPPPGGAPPQPAEVADVPVDPAVARAFALRAAQRAMRVALQDRAAFSGNNPFETLTEADQPLTQIFFSMGNYALGPNGKQLLERKLPLLTSDERPILIVGAADPSGTEQVNEKLSDARAQSVAEWLLAHGVDAQRIQTHAIGHEGAVGSTLDRRVDIWLGGSR